MPSFFGLHKSQPQQDERHHHTVQEPPPPPPYHDDEHRPPVVVAETTTTTTTQTFTTTIQTTHFFSLPLWRRRATPGQVNPTSARPSLAASGADDLGHQAASPTPPRVVSVNIDKALPPTPPSSDEGPHLSGPRVDSPLPIPSSGSSTRPSAERAHLSTPSVPGMSTPPPRSSFTSETLPISHPTAALARAALGLGLPHVMPHQTTTPTTTLDVNSAAFAAPQLPRSDQRSASSSSAMRRAKSFQRPVEEQGGPGVEPERRRTRGLSLGPFMLGQEGKGKAKASDEELTVPSLSRKSSFFTRLRRDSTKNTPKHTPPMSSSPAPASPLLRPVLPQLAPVSPMNFGTAGPMSAQVSQSSTAPPTLRRTHSERSRRHSTSIPHLTPLPPPSPLAPHPKVSILDADGRVQRRPKTSESTLRSRARSMFLDSGLTPPPTMATSSSLTQLDEVVTPAVPPQPPRRNPRPRAQTNPLSLNLFSNSASSLISHSPNPAPPMPFTSSPAASPRPSVSRPPPELLKPQVEESPEVYLERLTEFVSKAEMASVLASSPDAFHASALRAYIGRFQFSGDPLDVALRKLLIDVGLPRETQQIDRVIEAFSNRYSECNPGLFASDDTAYVLAFSLIMLHTDAFNKHNKRKMTKADYVKNTRMPGVAPEVLEYFFDNIIFAPFIYIEDPLDINGQRGLVHDSSRAPTLTPHSAPGGSSLLLKAPKIDAYYLITQNLLDPLRVATETWVPWQSPFSYEGTAGPWNEEELRRAFAKAGVIEVGGMDERRMAPSPFFSMAVVGVTTPVSAPGPGMALSTSAAGALADVNPFASARDVWTLKVTKAGLLQRKDDTAEGGRRAGNRKWREWSVILTGSQLLFFRDSAWAASFLAQMDTPEAEAPASLLRPDELVSVKGAIAVFDRSYTRYSNTFRFVVADGRHILLQAPNERELNEWIARINYASAFKTAGVRMRALGMSPQEVELTGVAAAASHLKDTKAQQNARPIIRRWDDRSADQVREDATADGVELVSSPKSMTEELPAHTSGTKGVDLEVIIPPQIESGTQFKATFDRVKADLAAGKWTEADLYPKRRASTARVRTFSLDSTLARSPTSPRSPAGSSGSGFLSRTAIIHSKVRELDARLSAVQTQLDTDLQLVRNVAVSTPFLRTTRERLIVVVQGVARKIAHARLEHAKLTCHRAVLVGDLRAAHDEWKRTHQAALLAAVQVLQSDGRSVMPVRANTALPRMEVEHASEDGDHHHRSMSSPRPIPRMSPGRTPPESRRNSSVTGSFHSALDFGLEWSNSGSTDGEGGLRSSGASLPSTIGMLEPGEHGGDSVVATPGTEDGAFGFPFVRNASEELVPVPPASAPAGTSIGGHERFYTAPEEQAEEWDKTQAAPSKRVSLVKLPSDLRISGVFRRTSARAESGITVSSPPPTFPGREKAPVTVTMLDL